MNLASFMEFQFLLVYSFEDSARASINLAMLNFVVADLSMTCTMRMLHCQIRYALGCSGAIAVVLANAIFILSAVGLLQ